MPWLRRRWLLAGSLAGLVGSIALNERRASPVLAMVDRGDERNPSPSRLAAGVVTVPGRKPPANGDITDAGLMFGLLRHFYDSSAKQGEKLREIVQLSGTS